MGLGWRAISIIWGRSRNRVQRMMVGRISAPPGQFGWGSIIYRDRGVPRFRAPTIREDGIKQGAANRPDTSGDVPCAEDGGGHGHPKGGGMAKRMEDEQNLITRRGGAWCKRAPAMCYTSIWLRQGSVFLDFLWGAFWRMEKAKFSQAPPR